MLQRAAEGGAWVDCEDEMVQLACAMESDECPAACREDASDEKDPDEKVKSGDLSVKATANNGGVILADGVSDLDTLTFKTSEEVEITKVVLERYGYSKNENVKRIWLEDDNGTVISNEATSLNSRAQATLTLKKDYRNVDGALNATIVFEGGDGTNGTVKPNAWNTIWFKVVDVTSTAKNVDLENYSPYTYSVVDYDWADLIFTNRYADKTYNWEAGEFYEVAKFKLKAPSDSAVEVKSFTLTDSLKNKIEYDEYLEDVNVTVAGKEVKSSWSVNKDDELVINLSDVELAAKDNSEFVVSIKLADGFDNMGESVNFYIASSSDISATDTKTNSRVLVKVLNTEWNAVTYDNTNLAVGEKWYTVKFEGGKVKISSTKLGNIEASEDSTDIVIAQWEITTYQTIKADKGVVKVTVTNVPTSAKVVKAMRLEIAGDEYEGSFDSTNNTFSFPSIDVDRSWKIRILVDTVETSSETAPYATFKIVGLKDDPSTVAIDWFYYEDSKTAADVAGSLNISRITLTASKATLTNTMSSDEVEFKAWENSDEVTILKGTYTAKKRDTYLSDFALTGVEGAWSNAHKMTVYLYINWEAVADGDLKYNNSIWTAGDSFSNVLVKAGETAQIELKAQVEAGEIENNVNFVPEKRLTLTVWWEDENWNRPSGTADKYVAKVSVVKKWTAEIESSAAKKTVLRRGSTDAIAEFIVKPSGANSIDLESVSFTTSEGVDCTKLKLEWAVDEDFRAGNNSTCIADGFVETIGKDWETLRVVFVEEPEIKYNLIVVDVNDIKINEKEVSGSFSKAYADVVVKFSQKWDKQTKTTYTVESLDKYNASTKIKNLKFFADDACEKKYTTDLTDGDTLDKGDSFSIRNMSAGSDILCMKYDVERNNSTVQSVVVKYSKYKDYFTTTNAGALEVYSNGTDNDPVDGNGAYGGTPASTTDVE